MEARAQNRFQFQIITGGLHNWSIGIANLRLSSTVIETTDRWDLQWNLPLLYQFRSIDVSGAFLRIHGSIDLFIYSNDR